MVLGSKMTRFNIWIIGFIVILIILVIISSIMIQKMLHMKIRKEIKVANAIYKELDYELKMYEWVKTKEMIVLEDGSSKKLSSDILTTYEKLNESLKLLFMLLKDVEETLDTQSFLQLKNTNTKMEFVNSSIDSLDDDISNFIKHMDTTYADSIEDSENFESIGDNVTHLHNEDDAGVRENVFVSVQASPLSTIQEGVEIIGDLNATHPLLIKGKVEGSITSTAGIEIHNTSQIQGDVIGGDVVIDGIIEGSVAAEKKVIVSSNANICGVIKASSLTISPGAVVMGEFHIGETLDAND